MPIAAITLLLHAVALNPGSGLAAAPPRAPLAFVDTTPVPQTGTTITVGAGGNFQAALQSAQPGDTIVLQAGAVYRGPFVLPVKSGSGWIVVKSSAEGSLPAAGTAITQFHASLMPKLEASEGAVIEAASGAHHFRFVGIEVRPAPGTFLYNLVLLGVGETSAAQVPHHIIFDRCYLHGDAGQGTRRGIAMNGAHIAVIDSYLSNFKEVGADSQAIAGWNGPGPFKITNNYLEGAGENVMFGGAPPAIPDLVPSDIEIRGNRFSKPLSWKTNESSYAGTQWTIKNLFELKNARRVLIDGNVFEYSWVEGQNGFAIVLTVRTEDGAAPWAVVEDVAFVNNTVRHAAAGVNILGRDDAAPSLPASRILIRNNLFEDIGNGRWGGGGQLFQLLAGTVDVVIDHNTGFGSLVIVADGEPHTGFVFQNNIVNHGEYGIIGSGTAPGLGTLARYFPNAVVQRNVLVVSDLSWASDYPPDNFFVTSLVEVQFVNLGAGDYRLAATSPFKGRATDGGDIGLQFTPPGGTTPPGAPTNLTIR